MIFYIKQFIVRIIILTQLISPTVFLYPTTATAAESGSLVCGSDLNGNGYLGDEGEYATCLTSPTGSLCPIGKVSCNSSSFVESKPSTTKCPDDTVLQGNKCVGVSVAGDNVWREYNAPLGGGQQDFFAFINSVFTQPGRPWVVKYIPSGFPAAFLGDADTGYLSTNSDIGKLSSGEEVKIYRFLNSSATQWDYNDYVIVKKGRKLHTPYNPPDYQSYSLLVKVGNPAPSGPIAVCSLDVDNATWKYIDSCDQASPIELDPIPSCEIGYNLDPTNKYCIINKTNYTCPINGNACVNDGSGFFCSPNACVDLNQTPPIDEGKDIDGTMLVDDGKKDEAGVCLDQMYIFSGRAQSCKLAGIETAFKNCCKSEGKVFTDNAGAAVSVASVARNVSQLYTAAQEAYTYYTVAMQATGDVAIASSMAAQGFSNAMVAMFNPATIAIGIALYFVMEFLMKACDQTSMETAMAAGSGYCHEVGTYCKKKIPLLGCVQEATSYCCFNTKLARIIHEQGRPQMKTFNGWGDTGSPQCRGFSPDEFQALDFSKIDLTEYVEDMVKRTTEDIQKDVNQITQDFYNKTN